MAENKPTGDAQKVPEPKEAKGQPKRSYVEYVPPNAAYTERRISKSDWAGLGIEAEDTVWNERNQKRVPEEGLSDQQLDYLERDGGFRFIEA